jgi:hypothetical protein
MASESGEAPGLFAALLDRFGELGGVELDLPCRTVDPAGEVWAETAAQATVSGHAYPDLRGRRRDG